MSQTDFDIAIHNRRILKILERTIDRVGIVTLLTNVVDEADNCISYVSQEVKEKLANVKARYGKGRRVFQSIDEEDISEEPGAFEKVTDHNEISALLDYLDNNDQVALCALKHNWKERAREERLRVSRLKNEQAEKEIAALTAELAEKKSDFNTSIIGKNLIVNRHQGKIERLRKITQEAIDWRAKECEAAIAAEKEASAKTQGLLQAELEECSRKYETILKDNLEEEKQLRMQRAKMENQLGSWMQAFDADMEDKQAEEEQLQAEFDSEKKKYEAIQKMLDEQEEEYDELMQEKAAYEQQLIEQKLFMFILNRSARRIQRAFRAYKLRKLAMKAKKGKKGKSKKK